MGSIHQRTLAPSTAHARPGPLMKRSFLWSSQRMRIWLYVLRRAKQYRKRQNLVVKAMATTMVDASYICCQYLSGIHLSQILHGTQSSADHHFHQSVS